MKISKGNVRNINKKILAGTIAFTFFATKVIGYNIVKQTTYDQFDKINISITKEYAILPEKIGLSDIKEIDIKNNYKKNNCNSLAFNVKRRVLKKF